MEPVTHLLTGACLSRSGLNRYAAYATLTMVVAAEFPDIDVLWSLRGPVAGFIHHRGITHSFLGIPFEAALIVAAVYGLHRIRTGRAGRRDSSASPPEIPSPRSGRRRPLTPAPVHWGRLYGLALVALLSHLLLDYTNNYGLRPFFPFNPHWYAASIVFIFDPLMFGMLLLALVVPWIFRLVSSEVGAKRQPFAARGWAIAALLGVVSLWTVREVEHNRAVQLAQAESFAQPAPSPPALARNSVADAASSPGHPGARSHTAAEAVFRQPQRVLASPDPLNPFLWYTVSDFGSFYQLGQADTRAGYLTAVEGIYSKPASSPAIRAAEASRLGRAYLDWSPAPIITVARPGDSSAAADSGDPRASRFIVVSFRDPRFMGNLPLLHSGGPSPLTGTVELNAALQVAGETMDGRPDN